jgi:hypothetical protein
VAVVGTVGFHIPKLFTNLNELQNLTTTVRRQSCILALLIIYGAVTRPTIQGAGICCQPKNSYCYETEVTLGFCVRFFLLWFCEAIGTIGTAATTSLFCQRRLIVKIIVEKQKESRLAGETEVLGENLPQRHFCPSQNPDLT